ncbi:Sirohydrochlorin ferrochelatase [Haloechinothrix alba]|uniref:Sirohydrochlorin ferrochelatase n=1 Tax=Haloechinothrix alba TaxID=664784 RepID=A0A238XIF7_9PSEU|nr:sirohydrochlorin chelatase [Haloechinothrix alba]SNR58717.1 Sirohydrochlorin ferrochelatase [Haloechinothrix alba]
MSTPPLVAVAHGSRDARSATTVRALARAVQGQAPDLEVRTAFLDLSEPTLAEVLGELHSAGHRDVVVVPLLLGSAFHARVDLPGLIADIGTSMPLLRVTVSGVLGPDPALESAALDRLRQARAEPGDPELGVVLTGVGSSRAAANEAVATIARRWHRSTGFAAVTHAFATARPGTGAALARLRARGAREQAIAPWFLAPGLLLDRIAREAPDCRIAEPLGDHPLVAELVLHRYHAVSGSTAHRDGHHVTPGHAATAQPTLTLPTAASLAG